MTARAGRSSSRHQTTSVTSPQVETIATPVPLSGWARWWARIGISAPNSGVVTVVPKSALYRSSSGCATRATSAGISSGRVVSTSITPPSGRWKVTRWKAPGWSSVFELGLGDRGAEGHVPERRGVGLVGLAAREVAQERALRGELRLVRRSCGR